VVISLVLALIEFAEETPQRPRLSVRFECDVCGPKL